MRKFPAGVRFPMIGLTMILALACNQSSETTTPKADPNKTGESADAGDSKSTADASKTGEVNADNGTGGEASGGSSTAAGNVDNPGVPQEKSGFTPGNTGEGDGVGGGTAFPVADGQETAENVTSLGRCVGTDVELPSGGGLGLVKGEVLSQLTGTWAMGLLPSQKKCLDAVRMGLSEDTSEDDIKSSGMESQHQELALNLLQARKGDGNKQAIQEANDAREALEEIPNVTMTVEGSTINQGGDDAFNGTLSVVSVSNDVAAVQCSDCGTKSGTVDIHFLNKNLIYITKGTGKTEGKAFTRVN